MSNGNDHSKSINSQQPQPAESKDVVWIEKSQQPNLSTTDNGAAAPQKPQVKK